MNKEICIKDKKLHYLSKTLSRTNRKDYENYIINRIYNLLNDFDIQPLSQKYVEHEHGKYYLIDLYFPQFNIGIEVDENHKKQILEDKHRYENIISKLNGYKEFRIPKDNTKPIEEITFDEIEKDIQEIVYHIKEIQWEQKEKNEFTPWIIDAKKFYEKTMKVSIKDNIEFSTIEEISLTVLKTKPKIRKGGFYFTDFNGKKAFAWFPQLTDERVPSKINWTNKISEDRKTITEIEKIGKRKKTLYSDCEVYTFMKIKNTITNKNMYKFLGIYKPVQKNENTVVYQQVKTEFIIPKNR